MIHVNALSFSGLPPPQMGGGALGSIVTISCSNEFVVSTFRNPLSNLIFKLLSIGLAFAVVGCATRPESISASFVSHEKYMGQTCPQLTDSMSDARAKLTEYSKMQDTKANVDAATVFLVLIPASKLSGDHAGDVAKFKGEVEAIETAQIKTGCRKPVNG